MTLDPDPDANHRNRNIEIDVHVSFSGNAWPETETALEQQTHEITGQTLSHILPLQLDTDSAEDVALEFSFLFTDDANIQELNRDFRNKDKPTNVLSFPDTAITPSTLEEARRFGDPLLVGDIALALETIQREADEQNKKFNDHLTHLIIHGILHLAGYDHLDDEEAEEMESLEIEILAKMGIDNPYKTDDS